jgi:hypothetical protein
MKNIGERAHSSLAAFAAFFTGKRGGESGRAWQLLTKGGGKRA